MQAPPRSSHTNNMGICTSTATCNTINLIIIERERKMHACMHTYTQREGKYPMIQMKTPIIERIIQRKAKGRPNKKPRGLNSQSQHIFFFLFYVLDFARLSLYFQDANPKMTTCIRIQVPHDAPSSSLFTPSFFCFFSAWGPHYDQSSPVHARKWILRL